MIDFVNKYKIISKWVLLGAGIFYAVLSAMATTIYVSSCVVTWFGLFSACASLASFIDFLATCLFIIWVALVVCFFVVIPIGALAWWLDDEGH